MQQELLEWTYDIFFLSFDSSVISKWTNINIPKMRLILTRDLNKMTLWKDGANRSEQNL
jgi:hypothetical protein